MIVLKPVRIDLARPARTVVHCMQTDNTQQVDVSLFVNNRPYDVTADVASGDDLTMAVAYILPNGFGDQYTATALGETAVEQDLSIAHLYHVMIDGACTDVDGFVQIIVKFTTDGGQILNWFPLTLDVIKSQPDDVDPGGNTPALSRYLRVDLLPPSTEDDTGTVTWDAATKQLKYIPGSGGGGGSADVTSAAVKSAIEGMSDAQKDAVEAALGYLTAHQNLPNLGSGYASSSNGATTAARTASLTGYKLVTGGSVKVLFTTAVNAANPTLNINSTGAKAIWFRGSAIASGTIVAGDLVTMVYDGTRYRITAFNRITDLTGYVTTTALGQALADYIPKAAQADAENFASALVVSPAGVDDNGAIKSPVAVYGTVTRSGSVGSYTYSANISATVLYPLQQTYPHMRAFLVDHEGRECTLIKPPASDQDNLVFYTLDKANKKIVYYTVATSGATTVAEDAYNGGGGGSTPLIVTIASDGQGGYTTDTSETDILAAAAAGRVIWANTPYGRAYYSNDDDGASFYGLVGPSNARSIPRFNIDGTTVTYSTFTVPSSGGSGGGAEVFDVVITTSPQSSSKSAAEIYAATQAGEIIRAKIDGNDAVILALAFQNEAVFYSIETDSGRVLSAVTVGVSSGNTTVSVDSWPIGNANEPDEIALTGATPAITVVVDNTIYTGGTLTSLDVGTWTSDRHFRLIFTSGSTATQLNWANSHAPVWPSNFNGTPAANTRYEIDVEGGYAVVGAWEVS